MPGPSSNRRKEERRRSSDPAPPSPETPLPSPETSLEELRTPEKAESRGEREGESAKKETEAQQGYSKLAIRHVAHMIGPGRGEPLSSHCAYEPEGGDPGPLSLREKARMAAVMAGVTTAGVYSFSGMLSLTSVGSLGHFACIASSAVLSVVLSKILFKAEEEDRIQRPEKRASFREECGLPDDRDKGLQVFEESQAEAAKLFEEVIECMSKNVMWNDAYYGRHRMRVEQTRDALIPPENAPPGLQETRRRLIPHAKEALEKILSRND
ncbi:hypothetical protein MRY87_10065 [bacterium]|nr:hypothetical protein [bacterium]